MPVTPTYPGVYVQEVPSGVRTIVGVSTSIALFVGRTKRGVLNKPTRCLGFADFERTFADDNTLSDMARYVKLFFLNGGTDCYILRIAHGATKAEVTLQSEEAAAPGVLTLTAKQAGQIGETIRCAVTYSGERPEATFNLRLFRHEKNSAGQLTEVEEENWPALSMNSQSPRYAPSFITENSKLVDATLAATVPAEINGFSQSGRAVAYVFNAADGTSLRDAWAALIGDAAGVTTNCFSISVDGNDYVDVDLSGIDVSAASVANPGAVCTDLAAAIEKAINDALSAKGLLGVTVDVEIIDGPDPGTNAAPLDASTLLRISSQNQSDILIRPAGNNDAAAPLMLGTAQGGLEISAHAYRRPAPTGITFQAADPDIWSAFAALEQDDVTSITLPAVDSSGAASTANVTFDLATTNNGDAMFYDDLGTSANNNNDGVREKLGLIRDAINKYRSSNRRTFYWKAELWGSRLAILPVSATSASVPAVSTSPTDISADLLANVPYYTVGIGGTAGRQTPAGSVALDGGAPEAADYDDAYELVESKVDLFNLLILPPDASPAAGATPEDLYGAASTFCEERRAFLIMDPPDDWTTAQTASEEVDTLRVGLVRDYSAVYYPRVVIREKGLKQQVGPAGAIAGLMARIDGTRGVWKAPAGTEADLRGIVGLEYTFSDKENGVLNKRAINTLRVFPDGIVSWGSRTMDGDDDFSSEYKYIPIRRLALFLEESLYRGLKWVVFEPNDEPLWAQIRLNVGAFMHDLFRKGAFQGTTPKEAYFVKCDAETTTQTDRNLGIVNIWVGFAPLKPAEFVIIYLQQMAGQIQV